MTLLEKMGWIAVAGFVIFFASMRAFHWFGAG